MRVIVVGGGLGGLALGSGLRLAGIEVTVIEQDTDLAATGGYHITLHREARLALRRLLPTSIYQQILASAADGSHRGPDALWDHHGREIGTIRLKGDDRGIDIDRITLRLLLAEAVGPALTTGRQCIDFEQTGDLVTCRLDDGTVLRSDLLVGADGVHSLIARRLATGPTNAPTGIVGISARTAASALRQSTRVRLGPRSSFGTGPNATALYLGYLDPAGHAVVDEPHRRRSVTVEPTYIWGAMFAEGDATRALPRDDSPALIESVHALLAGHGWSPALTEVVERSDRSSAGSFRFHAAPADARLQAPWPAGPVTALGDAVHATPPTAGMGAGAAIRDAAQLTEQLTAAHLGEKPLRTAVHEAEEGMRLRGAAVIEASMPTIRQILS